MSGAFRPLTAQIFAIALYKLVQVGIVTISVKEGKEDELNAVFAFLSGFSERFAGELITRTANAFGVAAGTPQSGTGAESALTK